jgi:multidrug transporter EmrE-like cation transporter
MSPIKEPPKKLQDKELQDKGLQYKEFQDKKLQVFVNHSPTERVSYLKWWFILLIILGIFFLVSILFTKGKDALSYFLSFDFNLLETIIPSLYASSDNELIIPIKNIKNIIIFGVFSALGFVYFIAVFKVFFSKNPNNVDSATDLIKTLTGFFVGVGTSFFN